MKREAKINPVKRTTSAAMRFPEGVGDITANWTNRSEVGLAEGAAIDQSVQHMSSGY